MNTATSYEMHTIRATPWAPSRAPLANLKWRRIASEASLLAGLFAFAVCMVALRLSLYPQAIVSSRIAVLTTLIVGAAGIGAFFAAHFLHEPPAD
jgi:hypothetical protein